MKEQVCQRIQISFKLKEKKKTVVCQRKGSMSERKNMDIIQGEEERRRKYMRKRITN